MAKPRKIRETKSLPVDRQAFFYIVAVARLDKVARQRLLRGGNLCLDKVNYPSSYPFVPKNLINW